MEEMTIKLTRVDRIILESYKHYLDGLSDYLGDSYEIVLHSLESFDHSVIKIINGHYTGRTEGAPITDLALNMLARIKTENNGGYTTYFCKNKKGEPLKSSTITIKGEGGRIIGLVCINMYLNVPFFQVVRNLFPRESTSDQAHNAESFVENIDELLYDSATQIRNDVLNNPSVTAANKNKEIIIRLYERGIFNIKDSVIKIADFLGISKNTVYMHIRNINGGSVR